MRKVIFTIFILFLFVYKLFPQTWSQTRGPTVGIINSFEANSEGVLFVGLGPVLTGLKTEFYRSTNNGLTWGIRETDANYIYDMFVKKDTLYIATDLGLKKSTNNGSSWVNFGFSQDSYCIFSNNDYNNFFTGNSLGGVYRTTNSGENWTKVLNTSNIIQNISGDSSKNVFAAGNNFLYKSSNSGNSWDTVLRVNSSIKCVRYIKNGLVFAGTADSGLFSSTNFGINWSRLTTPFNSALSISVNSLNKIVIASESGLWSSTDNGQNWVFVSGLIQNLKEIFFTSANLLLAGTTYGIYISNNEGTDWSSSGIKQAEMVDIYTRVPGKIFALDYFNGTKRSLWSTTNRGVTWVRTYSNNQVLKVAAFDSNVYIGTFSSILRSTDNGYDFHEVFISNSVCQVIKADSIGNVYAGFGNGFYKSTNNGNNWFNVNNINHIIYDMYIVNQNLMYVCGFGKIYKSTDGGNVWNLIFNMGTDVLNIAATSNGYIIIDYFNGYRSSNFGQSWTSLGWPGSVVIDHFVFDKQNNFYFNLGNDIYKSTNYGTTYELFNDNLPGNVTCIGLAPDDYLYVGNFGNSVFKTNSVLTNVNYPNELPSSLKLFQNYPNPFNPSTKINFSIPKRGFVTLKVYDILGKELFTLINEQRSEGSYEVEFNGSNLPSGVYFYRIESGDFSDEKRMVMIK